MRAKMAGWTIYFIPDAEVTHIGGASSKTRKDKSIENKSAQVLIFRMRSEWLYYRKNKGVTGLLSSAGIELLWYAARFTKNLLFPFGGAGNKRLAAISIIKQIITSLQDTKFGSFSPPIPW